MHTSRARRCLRKHARLASQRMKKKGRIVRLESLHLLTRVSSPSSACLLFAIVGVIGSAIGIPIPRWRYAVWSRMASLWSNATLTPSWSRSNSSMFSAFSIKRSSSGTSISSCD